MAYIRVNDRDFAFRVKDEDEARGIAEFLKKKHQASTYEIRMSSAGDTPRIIGQGAQNAAHTVNQPLVPTSVASPPPKTQPVAAAPSVGVRTMGGPSAETSQAFRVLVVDDEPDLREILADAFESKGCKVYQAGNARAGVMLAQANQVDLIVSDVKMAGGDGIELFEAIKSGFKEPPTFILMTAFEDERTKKTVKDNDLLLLRKPFDMMDVVEQFLKGEIQSKPKKAA